jgi:hypothetical protein
MALPKTKLIFFIFLSLFLASLLSPKIKAQTFSSEPPVNYAFRDNFYASPALKIRYDVYETAGFLLFRSTKRGRNTEFSIVTGFEHPVLESRVLKNIRAIEDANTFLERNTRKIIYERIPIRELPLTNADGAIEKRYWVGQKAFSSLEIAQSEITAVKAVIQAGGGDFNRALELISEFFSESPGPTAEEVRANYQIEEELALKILDWLDVGDRPYGILTGTPMGEPILWQAFGETTYRFTNLDTPRFNSQVGFWTNRLVFKGINLPGKQTLDPYVEITTALESNGKNFPSHLDLVAGLEYRPFGRTAYFDNFNIDGFHLLKFVRNYRFYVQYMERRNITDEITGSRDTDLWLAADIFYEWGLDLEDPWVKPHREGVKDWVRDYVWGEYFGNYRYQRSDFSGVDSFNSWILNSSVILGIKWPELTLPRNPINNKLTVMPYVRLEHITNPNRLGIPFQNRFFVAAGVRWMPFRSYQFEHNEWLYLTKLFAEYVGVGTVNHPGGAKPDNTPSQDWILGIKTSYKRF